MPSMSMEKCKFADLKSALRRKLTFNMTEIAEEIYRQTERTYKAEFCDGCEIDMLDNLKDLFSIATDDFLEQFTIEYYTDTEHWDEEDLEEGDTQTETYIDPVMTFRLKSTSCVYFEISCRGFDRCDGAYWACEPNANNEDKASDFYESFCEKFIR